MTDEIRRALCKHNKDNPSLTQKQLQEWVHSELIIEKAKKFMKDMYPVDTPDFTFSIGWLGKFKARYGIKNFRRFGESGSVEMEGMEDKLKSIRDKVDQFEMKDIFNMDETGLFFRLQPDHSLATMQLEGKKQDKERLLLFAVMRTVRKNFLYGLLGNMLNQVYKWLKENIESVIGINKDDIDEEDDESSTMEPPSRNEAIKAAITLNNFLLSYEKTTPEVLTMLRKIRDEIQGEIDFNKKQKTIESFFKKPS
ncbi:CENP-B homolog protein 2-like protein [Tanacetum coccineum]